MRTGERADAAGGRVFMLCVDAMSLDFVRAHLDHLPAFRKMLDDGALRPLASPADLVSASVWPSFATGDDPGVHGHYFPFQWDASSMRFRRSQELSRAIGLVPFWHDLARQGVPCVAFDAGVPIRSTDAPCPEITNWSYQSSGAASASDPALLRELRRRFGQRPIGKEVPVPKTLRQGRKIRDDMVRAVEKKTAATVWLMNRCDWRFFIAGFYEIHRAGHNLLVVPGDFGSAADKDALLEVYKAQDRAIARIAEAADDGQTTLILFALHGMAANRAQDHFLDEILTRLNDVWRRERGAPTRPKKSSNLMAGLRAHVPYGLQYSLAYLLGESVQDWVVNRTLVGGFDWAATPSFRLLSGGEAYVRFNVKGRERDGYFNPAGDELPAYRHWLKERLREIRVSGSDEPLFSDVIDGAAAFPGSRAPHLPDLIMNYGPDAPETRAYSSEIGEISAHLATGRGGNHTGDAFMVATGPGAESAALSDVSDIKDLKRCAESLLAAPGSSEERRPAVSRYALG